MLDPCYALGYRNFDVCFFVLLRLRVLLFGEIKCYKSPIRIRIDRICRAHAQKHVGVVKMLGEKMTIRNHGFARISKQIRVLTTKIMKPMVVSIVTYVFSVYQWVNG